MAFKAGWPEDIPEDHVVRILEAAGIKPDTAYMAVPRCVCCAHWGSEDDEQLGHTRRACQLIGEEGTPAACDDPYCCLETGPGFGCTLFKPKEK